MSKIFFSYAWAENNQPGENREAIVNNLYDSLQKDGYELVRDKVMYRPEMALHFS